MERALELTRGASFGLCCGAMQSTSQVLINQHSSPVACILWMDGYVVGVEGAVIIGKLLEKSEAEGTAATLGYNAATGAYEDLVKAGIIDPLKVWCKQGICLLRISS